MKKVCLVVGHDLLRKGAYSSSLNTSEYNFNLSVAKASGLDYVIHRPNYGYKSKMKATYQKLSHYDLTVELHFNAAIPQANGVECLHYHTNQVGWHLSTEFCKYISKVYGTRNRGAKQLSNSNQRGFWAVASGIPTGLLVEPFFGSSNYEANKFKDIDKYAKHLKTFLNENGYN